MTTSTHETRLTLDFDGYHGRMRFNAVRAYHTLDRLAEQVEVRVSTSGDGLHLIGYFSDRLSVPKQMKIRRTLSDDWNRIHLDNERMAHGHTGNVLWSEKAGNDGDPQVFADIYDALDHLDLTGRTDYERVHALANEGHRACDEMASSGLSRTHDFNGP